MSNENQGSIVAGLGWIIFLSILLFWLPFFGPLIAGFVGGRKSGNLKNGIIAALLPAIIISLIIALTFSYISPVLGTIYGGSMFLVIIRQSSTLILGSILGGITV